MENYTKIIAGKKLPSCTPNLPASKSCPPPQNCWKKANKIAFFSIFLLESYM